MDNQELDQRFQKFCQGKIARKIRTLKFLNAGWEGGAVDVPARGITVRLGSAGGMAVVVPQLPVEIPMRASERGFGWRIDSVAPLFTDVISAIVKDANGKDQKHDCDGLIGIGVIQPAEFGDWEFPYGGRIYKVRVWKITDIGHRNWPSTQYLLAQDELWGPGNIASASKPGGRDEQDLYEVPGSRARFPPKTPTEYCSSHYAMAHFQRIRYLIFSRAVAKLYSELKCDLLISHDYHGGLAPFFAAPADHPEQSSIIQFSIGHNLGYQGVDGFYKPNTESSNVKCVWDNREELWEDYCKVCGLDRRVLDDYLLAWKSDGAYLEAEKKRVGDYMGTPDWIQGILRLNYYKTGLAATTVSQHYAEELRTQNRKAIIDNIRVGGSRQDLYFSQGECQKRLNSYFGETKTQQDDLFFPNRNLSDLENYHTVGVLNGMPLKKHLRCNTKLLAKLIVDYAPSTDPELKMACQALRLPTDLQERLSGRNDLLGVVESALTGTPEDERMTSWIQTSEQLACIRKIARRLLFDHHEIRRRRLRDKGQAIHFAWGRLVNQKAFHIIKEEIDHITKARDELLIILATAPPSDVEGIEVEEWLREEGASDNSNFVFVNRFDEDLRDRCLLAATVAPLTSIYEPCGLTDVEAYWSGTLCAVHRVGGLVKGIEDQRPHYGQIGALEPKGVPVAEGYDFFDSTDPKGEALAFRAAYERVVNLFRDDPKTFEARQFKAFQMTEFAYDIPANRYVDLLQFVWISQAWRWLKDEQVLNAADKVSKMVQFIRGADSGFVPGSGKGCESSLVSLYQETFIPPEGRIGINFLDSDIKFDQALRDVLKGGITEQWRGSAGPDASGAPAGDVPPS